MPDKLKVAISSDFFTAFSKLPQSQQSKVTKFITNFQKNPKSSGFNYEKIANAKDPNMRSVRIDQAYRGIVLKPDVGNIYMLLWVDHHNDAYEWARRHKCSINPETGAVQIYNVEHLESQESSADSLLQTTPGAYEELKDKQLLRLGVPEEQIPLIKTIKNEVELDEIQHRIPIEAYEGLFMYLAGSRYDEIINQREFKEVSIDTEDYSTALVSADSRSKFVVVDNELKLAKMLNAPLEKWRVFLHPSQRRLVEGTKTGSVRVLGGAGTGKTVVAMHRAECLSEDINDKPGRILFTTYTKNLATDIESNLDKLCSPECMSKIEVVNLDKWVSNFLNKHGYSHHILYWQDTEDKWDTALDLRPPEVTVHDSFYREEWVRIIQAYDIETVEQYIEVSRVGRGTSLTRSDRVKIWPVFEEYRNLLNLAGFKEVDDAYRDAAAILNNQPNLLPYTSVIVDEAQDMSSQAFKLIRAMVPQADNDIFIVGDGHQKIYGKNRVVLSHCGIDIQDRDAKLRLNYRTTEEIRTWAVKLLEGKKIDDLNGGFDTNEDYKSLTHGKSPMIENFDTQEKQAEYIAKYLNDLDSISLSSICVVARTNNEIDSIGENLKAQGISVKKITATSSEQGEDDSVRIATMHRVKGLEFDEIVLASINDGMVPLSSVIDKASDKIEAKQLDLEERALIYVAVTRAKKVALITNYGMKSTFL